MDTPSDSDDSAFLFSMSMPKRKAECNVNNKLKKLRLNSNEQNKSVDEIISVLPMDEQISSTSSISDSNHVNSEERNESHLSDGHTALSNCNMAEDVNVKRLLSQKLDGYFSCPLCLKNYQSEAAHFVHMKQCAKKSKMSAKQLLEALNLHKRHLKERLFIGLNYPTKKKKIREPQDNRDSSYQLAIGLALSKSLQDMNVAGKENQTVTDDVSIRNTNKTTLEKFGFKSSLKKCTGTEKSSKIRRIIHCVLKQRTSEEREKLVTEKASTILLINDYSVISESRDSLRMYQSKILEGHRNKDSHLWNLGEKIDETEWYVEDLKGIILQEKNKIVNTTYETVNHERCIDEEVLKLNLPNKNIFEDWRRLVNNKHLSDISLSAKGGETIYLHSVVLYARCEKLLDSDLKSIFHKFDICVILRFLQFLYCGSLNGLMRGEIEYLFDLARSVDCQELVKILDSLKKYLLEPKRNGGNGNDSNRSSFNSFHDYRKNISVPEKNITDESEGTNFGVLEEKFGVNVSRSEENGSGNEHIGYENNIDMHRQEKGEEANLKYEISNKLKKEGTIVKYDRSLLCADDANDETCSGKEKWNYREQVDQFETDMFAEMEKLNRTVDRNFETDSNQIAEDEPACLVISSGSTKSGGTLHENRENFDKSEKILSELDYEIPYFDPYEHFNNEIPEMGPCADLEGSIHSQSLIMEEISPVKSESPKPATGSDVGDASPSVTAPGWCSTPNNDIPEPSKSANIKVNSKEFSAHAKRRRHGTPCSRINRRLGRASVKSKLFSAKSGKKRKTVWNKENTENLESVLTESVLREFHDSIRPSVSTTPPTEEANFVEVTPIITDEEYIENVSPFPDYSVMGATSIKKHLAKYGLKKSLSKNKAKKILRHIYEELHPVVNLKNGKIVKYIRSEKSRKCGRKKIVRKDKMRKGKVPEKKSLTPKKIREISEERENETCEIEHESPTQNKTRNFMDSPKQTSLESTRTMVKDGNDNNSNDVEDSGGSDGDNNSNDVEDSGDSDGEEQSYTTINSDDSYQSDENYPEVEEPLSQGNYSSAADAVDAVYDFIEQNQEIHRQILEYESISLEEFQKQLLNYCNKKFRLVDLMDCLDAECITFHSEQDEQSKSSRRKLADA